MPLKVYFKLKKEVRTELLDELHRNENALLHQKSLNQIVTVMVPVLVKIIEEGID